MSPEGPRGQRDLLARWHLAMIKMERFKGHVSIAAAPYSLRFRKEARGRR